MAFRDRFQALSFSAPSASEKETARRLLAEGRSEREAGNHREALGRFQAAHDIMRVPTTGLELAKSQVQLGFLVEASTEPWLGLGSAGVNGRF